jgi:hypothetical protein
VEGRGSRTAGNPGDRPPGTDICRQLHHPAIYRKDDCRQAGIKGVQALDAPVSGGDIARGDATLTIMVGGPESALEKVMPVFSKPWERPLPMWAIPARGRWPKPPIRSW